LDIVPFRCSIRIEWTSEKGAKLRVLIHSDLERT
jgi:hypothetical protein